MSIQSARKAKIILLLAKKISVLEKYTEFLDIFFKKSTTTLPNCLDINKYAIHLELSKQPPYKTICS